MVAGTEHLNAGHVVQFYGHDSELADRVAGHLLGALDGGGVAVVIATAAHRRAFEERLAQAGADLAAVGRSGAYLVLDAGQAVHAVMTAGRVDRDGFERVIGGLIARAGQDGAGQAGGGRPVRVYGEVVALLWDAGLVSAAVEIEEMWNELGRRYRFSLVCGYPADSVTRAGQLEAFADMCRAHQEVVGVPSAAVTAPGGSGTTRAFAFSPDAPAAARHFTVDAVRRLGAADLADDAALVVTELAANAVVHAHSGFTVDLTARPGVLRISVRDASPLPPAGAAAALPLAPLHGLGAVDALASRWGAEPLGHAGKAVWVELRR